MNSARTISFVATSRNDDHGGDVLRRTQSFIRYLALQAERHQVRCELVMVDWNPPTSRAPLADVLDWPAGSEWFQAKVVTVPRAVHLTLPNARSLTMYQMIAKNAGIRRASGDFVIATNIDIIFSDALFRWLRTAELDHETLYRSDRWDMPNDVQLEPDFDRLLERAHDDTFRKNLAEGTATRVDGEWRSEKLARVDRYLLGSVNAILEHSLRLLEQGHSPKAELEILLNDVLPRSRRFYLTPAAHLNGCGDFTMTSRAAWDRVRGYPEWPVFSWNIDSVGLIHAAYEGLAHTTLRPDAVHFHIEHDYGSGYTPGGGMNALLRRMAQRGTPVLEWGHYQELLLDLSAQYEAGLRVQFNSSQWGFADIELPELRTSVPDAPPRRALTTNKGPVQELFAEDRLTSARIEPWEADAPAPNRLEWDNGDAVLTLELEGGSEAPAASFTLPRGYPERTPVLWLRFWTTLHAGEVAFSVEDEDGAALTHLSALDVSDGRRELIIRVDPSLKPNRLVVRGASDAGLKLSLGPIEVFWPTDPAHSVRDLPPPEGWFSYEAFSPESRPAQQPAQNPVMAG